MKEAEEVAASRLPLEPASVVSATNPDWSREKCSRFRWDPPRQLLRAIRLYQRAAQEQGPLSSLRRRLSVLQHRFWSVVSGAEIPLTCQIGGGLLIPHPNGIVIHPDATIGPNCLFFQQVTIGTGPTPGVPQLGGHVDVGAGAKILGGVRIGDHARIGANAVVVTDIPRAATVGGIPARVLR
jgi:serine O-acetyltransferase